MPPGKESNMTEKVTFSWEAGHTPPAPFSSPSALGQWTAEALRCRLDRGETEVCLPCWAALGAFSPAAGALAVLRAVMEVVYSRPALRTLTLLCASPEELAVFRFQWNMWFAASKPPHDH